MSFSVSEIAGMLQEYEADHHTGMDISLMSGLLYASTSGYPYLVSRLCKLIDERISGTKEFPDKADAWTRAGYLEAEKRLLTERNTLFESLVNKLTDYPQLRTVLYELLFTGKAIPYNPLNQYIDTAEMFGFVKNSNGNAVVANRIFESVLYNEERIPQAPRRSGSGRSAGAAWGEASVRTVTRRAFSEVKKVRKNSAPIHKRGSIRSGNPRSSRERRSGMGHPRKGRLVQHLPSVEKQDQQDPQKEFVPKQSSAFIEK